MADYDSKFYAERAHTYSTQGNYQAAIADYTESIRLNPEDADTHYDRAGIYFDLNQWEEAIADFTEVIRLTPQAKKAYHNRAVIYHNLGWLEQAIADYTEAIRIDSELDASFSNRGLIYLELGRYKEAIANYTEAIRLKPHYYYYVNRGAVFLELGRYKEAIADYTEVIELKPDETAAYIYRGDAYLELGRHKEAIADHTEAIRLDPHHELAYYYLGRVYLRMNNFTQTQTNYIRHAFNGKKPASVYYLLNFFQDFADVPFVVNRLIVDYPHINDLQSYQGFLLHVEEQSRLSLNFLDYLLMQGWKQHRPEAYWHLSALVQYYMGDTAEAFRIFDEEIDQGDPLSLFTHYYYVKSAIFSALHEDSVEPLRADAIEAARSLLAAKQTSDLVELYYAGLILYQYADDTEQAMICFQRAKGLLSAQYLLWQLAPFETREALRSDIVKREASLPADKSFAKGLMPRRLGRDQTSYWGAMQHYCFYQEILLATQELYASDEAFRVSPFYEYWRFELTPSEQQELLAFRKARQTEETLRGIDATLNDMKRRMDYQQLEASLKRSVTSIMREFEALQKDASELSAPELEFRLASHIYESAILKHYEALHLAGFDFLEIHLKLATYFFLTGNISTRTAVHLLLYAIYTSSRYNPKLLHTVTKEGILEGTIDDIKSSESLKDAGILLAQTVSAAFATSWGTPLSVFLISFSVKALWVLMNETLLQPPANQPAGVDYERFNADLDAQLKAASELENDDIDYNSMLTL